jgi:hypothetical protein
MAATVDESTPPDMATAIVGFDINSWDAVAKKSRNGSGRTDYLDQL